MTSFFGERWDAPLVEDATRVPVPAGQLCLDCREPIEAGDRGLIQAVIGVESVAVAPIHLECLLRSTLSHYYRQCGCYVAHATLRDEARATLVAINVQRADQSLGPL